MARADSAQASARAGAMRGLACTTAQPALPRLAQREVWMRRAVPAMVALFAGALVAITVVMTREAYDRTVTDAFTDIELTAAVVTGNLNGALRDSLKTDPAAALASLAKVELGSVDHDFRLLPGVRGPTKAGRAAAGRLGSDRPGQDDSALGF